MGYSTTPIANLKGPKGDPGAQGEPGLPGVNGVPADEAVAAYIANPEGDAGNQVDIRVAAGIDSDPKRVVRHFIGADTGAARPNVAGPVEWLITVDVIPSNIRIQAPVGVEPDSWAYVNPATIPWAPLTDSGLQMWYDVTKPKGAVAATEGEALSTYVDGSPKGRDLLLKTSTGAGLGGNPVYHTGTFGGKPAIQFPYTGGLQAAFERLSLNLGYNDNIIIGANVQFGASGTNSRTVWTFGGGTNGTFSLFKTSTGAWGISLDGTTVFTGGTADTAPHSVLMHVQRTHVRLWVDGTAVIDTDHTYTYGSGTGVSFRLGYVAASSAAATLRPLNGGYVGDVFVVTRSATVSPNTQGMRDWLAGRR